MSERTPSEKPASRDAEAPYDPAKDPDSDPDQLRSAEERRQPDQAEGDDTAAETS